MTTLDKMLQGLANALGASLSTLTTTAKTVVGAINELKSGLTTANTNISTNTTKIGTGSLNTTAQTIIPAINELKNALPNNYSFSGSKTASYSSGAAGGGSVEVFSLPAATALYAILITVSGSRDTLVDMTGGGVMFYSSYSGDFSKRTLPASRGANSYVWGVDSSYGTLTEGMFVFADGTAPITIYHKPNAAANVTSTYTIKAYRLM